MGIGEGTLERCGKFCKSLNMRSEEEGKDVAGVSSLDEVR